jgi:hypothetical protein
MTYFTTKINMSLAHRKIVKLQDKIFLHFISWEVVATFLGISKHHLYMATGFLYLFFIVNHGFDESLIRGQAVTRDPSSTDLEHWCPDTPHPFHRRHQKLRCAKICPRHVINRWQEGRVQGNCSLGQDSVCAD